MHDHLYFGQPEFLNSKDSAEYTLFRQRMTSLEATVPTDTMTIQYHLVWSEHQHGGSWTVDRGDGSVIKASPSELPFDFQQMSIAFRTTDGRRGLMLMHDVPCGLICRNAHYYVDR